MKKNFLYEILGLEKKCSDEDIKRAYRRMVKLHHPDIGGDIKKFEIIKKAYEILSDKNKREIYDNKSDKQIQKKHYQLNKYNYEALFSKKHKTFTIFLEFLLPCELCNSAGFKCSLCKGSGIDKRTGKKCSKCNGHKYENPYKCKKCWGAKKIIKRKKITLKMPKEKPLGNVPFTLGDLNHVIHVKFI